MPISLHCWQGDDVGGFESAATELGGGLAATGNYPGQGAHRRRAPRATPRRRSRSSRHAPLQPARVLRRVRRPARSIATRLRRSISAGWIDWAKALGIGLDFNPTFFSHPHAPRLHAVAPRPGDPRSSGSVTAWRAARSARRSGKALGTPCVTNLWIPDGMKDTPVDRVGPRERLIESLDAIFKEPIDPAHNLDAVEGKLFGIGFESYTVGSHEFYFGYALIATSCSTRSTPGTTIRPRRSPTRLSAVFMYLPEILLHVSRGVRWDSDHVVVLNDDLEAIAQELVRGDFLDRDAHRARLLRREHQPRRRMGDRHAQHAQSAAEGAARAVGACCAGVRAAERLHARLALLEEFKALPWGAVWDYYCAAATCRRAHRGWTASTSTKKTCWRSR